MFSGFAKASFSLALMAFAVLTVVSTAHSDLASVGMQGLQESVVASSIRSAAEVQALSDELGQVMDEYDVQREKCMTLADPVERAKCNENLQTVLARARDILKKLNQQADSVESRISLASNEKPINPGYMEKVDRVLASVREMRKVANKRVEDATKPA